ncbi:FMRFamide receptor-like isoform X2 [Planococcus citri]|uniref:FMRFamide receptor-like isoform X2 n=1 Tax=Planococcus citri TaxID=170843 RepID=UPI0031F97090
MGDIALCHPSNETLPTNVTSPEIVFLEATRFWIQRVLTPIIVFIGIIGNLVTIAVLTQRRMKSSTNTYLTALAVTDLLYLICFFLLSLQHYSGSDDSKYQFYWRILPFIFWYIDASSGTSTWLTVSFTLERYIAVCQPLRGRVLCTESRARKVITCVTIFNLLATITTPFEWKVCHKSEKKLTLDTTEFGNNNTYKVIYYWLTAFIFVYIPLVLLCVLNTLLVEAVRNSRKQQNSLTQMKSGISSREKQENKITMALVAVVLLFIICQIPTTIMLLVSIFYSPPEKSAGYYYKRGLNNICNFLMCINTATNFLLYCAMSDKYRRTLIVTFLPCISRHHRAFTVSSLASYRSSMRGSVRQPRVSYIIPEKENTLRPPSVRY